MSITALIDFDEVVYQAGFGSQHTVYRVYVQGEEEDGYIASFRYKKPCDEWVNNQEDLVVKKEVEVESLHLALYNTRKYIETIIKNTKADRLIGFFTGDNNFRDGVATILPYKGNRDAAHKPYYYSAIKDFLKANYNHEVVEGAEADDGMSSYQWPIWDHETTVICTNDKDLNMVPGWRYVPGKRTLSFITPLKACRSFYQQLISGDGTDNIPGLYKITGHRVNKKVYLEPISKMETEEEMYEHVLNAYEGRKEDVQEIGTLLWMLRSRTDGWIAGEDHYDLDIAEKADGKEK